MKNKIKIETDNILIEQQSTKRYFVYRKDNNEYLTTIKCTKYVPFMVLINTEYKSFESLPELIEYLDWYYF